MLDPEAVEIGGSKPYYHGAHSLKRKTNRKQIIISDIVEIFTNLMGTLREIGKLWLWKLGWVSQRRWYWRGVEKWDGGILDGQNSQSVKGSECTYRKSPTYQSSSCKLSKMWTRIWFQQEIGSCVVNVRDEWNRSWPSVSSYWWSLSSIISHLFFLFQSVTLLVLDSVSAPVCQLLYCITVLFKVQSCKIKNVNFLFLCIICVKSVKSLLRYSNTQPVV